MLACFDCGIIAIDRSWSALLLTQITVPEPGSLMLLGTASRSSVLFQFAAARLDFAAVSTSYDEKLPVSAVLQRRVFFSNDALLSHSMRKVWFNVSEE